MSEYQGVPWQFEWCHDNASSNLEVIYLDISSQDHIQFCKLYSLLSHDGISIVISNSYKGTYYVNLINDLP